MESGSTNYANAFAKAMLEDPYLKQFKTFNPNLGTKASCDPGFTKNEQCKGTLDTCKYEKKVNVIVDDKTGKEKPHPQNSCWRYAYRFRLEDCRDNRGFMIQVEGRFGLAPGQKSRQKWPVRLP
eukprot:UN06634